MSLSMAEVEETEFKVVGHESECEARLSWDRVELVHVAWRMADRYL